MNAILRRSAAAIAFALCAQGPVIAAADFPTRPVQFVVPYAPGGSGDVLTGILTGLMAQKYSAEDAAVLGVYIHGMAGDLAARERSMTSLVASDLVAFLPTAFRDL